MDQASVKPATPAQNSTTRQVAANPTTPTVHPSDEGVFKSAASLQEGNQLGENAFQPLPSIAVIRTNDLTHASINDQNTCQSEGSNSAAIGALGVDVFRRQMQNVRRLVLLFHLGERCHQSPGVLRRHFTILLPFDARQFRRRHQGNK